MIWIIIKIEKVTHEKHKVMALLTEVNKYFFVPYFILSMVIDGYKMCLYKTFQLINVIIINNGLCISQHYC
jgi:hypothetical protein